MAVTSRDTALVAAPPPAVCGPIQAIRDRYDPQASLVMPHITLLFPFVPEASLAAVLPRLEAACRRMAPIPTTLRSVRFFGSTAWLAPEPREAYVRLHARALGCALDCEGVARQPGGYEPHLTIGEHVPDSVLGDWRPVRFDLAALTVLVRGPDGVYRARHAIPLAGPAAEAAATE